MAFALIGVGAFFATRPHEVAPGVFSPSPLTIAAFTHGTSDYDHTKYASAYTGDKKVLVVCTEEADMTMASWPQSTTSSPPPLCQNATYQNRDVLCCLSPAPWVPGVATKSCLEPRMKKCKLSFCFLLQANGHKFHTGNHPVETLVPLLHLKGGRV